ncbi:uncharacterized protein LOC118146292 [Callithrix jacchus]
MLRGRQGSQSVSGFPARACSRERKGPYLKCFLLERASDATEPEKAQDWSPVDPSSSSCLATYPAVGLREVTQPFLACFLCWLLCGNGSNPGRSSGSRLIGPL